MGSSSAALLVHIAGAIAISQLILSRDYRGDYYLDLNSNATSVLHQTFDRFAEALSFFSPAGSLISVGALLQAIVYLTAALYVFYLARLVAQYSRIHTGTCGANFERRGWLGERSS